MTMQSVNTTFGEIFRRVTYTGSFYDGLKIYEATEYDVNLVIKPNLRMELVRENCPPGFIAIKINEDEKILAKPYKNWLYKDESSDSNFLNPNAVRFWLQGVVTQALNKVKHEGLFGFQLKIREAGPAWTLVVTCKDQNKTINIDLVPCLEFSNSDWLEEVPRKSELMKGREISDPWFAVPKPSKKDPRYELYNVVWRLSFPLQETRIIRGLNYLKYTLRLLKRVRDQLEIYAVASYYIKTLFLWELENNDRSIWREKRRGCLFVYMLVRFKEALEKECINFFWEKDCNLIENVQPEFLFNSARRLEKFLVKIDKYITNEDEDGLRKFIRNLGRKRNSRRIPRKNLMYPVYYFLFEL